MSEFWPCVGEFPMKVVEHKFEVLKTKDGRESDYIFLLCQVTEGPHAGSEAGMKVFLLKKDGRPNELARETLRIAGWNGKDFRSLPGLGTTVFPGIMVLRTWDGGERVELTGIKGVSQGFRGAAMDKSKLSNLAKLFDTKTPTDENDEFPI
jgi:hypothetical protein